MLFIVHYFALPQDPSLSLSLSLSLSEHSSFNYCFETMVIIIVGGSSGFKLRRDFDATTTTTPPRIHANSPPTLQPMPGRKQGSKKKTHNTHCRHGHATN
jgi:hypothetical protein